MWSNTLVTKTILPWVHYSSLTPWLWLQNFATSLPHNPALFPCSLDCNLCGLSFPFMMGSSLSLNLLTQPHTPISVLEDYFSFCWPVHPLWWESFTNRFAENLFYWFDSKADISAHFIAKWLMAVITWGKDNFLAPRRNLQMLFQHAPNFFHMWWKGNQLLLSP